MSRPALWCSSAWNAWRRPSSEPSPATPENTPMFQFIYKTPNHKRIRAKCDRQPRTPLPGRVRDGIRGDRICRSDVNTTEILESRVIISPPIKGFCAISNFTMWTYSRRAASATILIQTMRLINTMRVMKYGIAASMKGGFYLTFAMANILISTLRHRYCGKQ